MGALGAGGSLHISQVPGMVGERTVGRERQVFGMSTERALDISEHPVADLERRDAAAHLDDAPANSLPKIVARGRISPVKNRMKKGLAARHAQSVRFTVVACTRTSTSASPMVGLSTSTTRTTSSLSRTWSVPPPANRHSNVRLRARQPEHRRGHR